MVTEKKRCPTFIHLHVHMRFHLNLSQFSTHELFHILIKLCVGDMKPVVISQIGVIILGLFTVMIHTSVSAYSVHLMVQSNWLSIRLKTFVIYIRKMMRSVDH